MLVGLSMVAFMLIHLVPGDPVRLVLGPRVPQSQVGFVRHQLGLDKPLLTQYRIFAINALQGNFGTSVTTPSSVNALVGPRVLVSLSLISYSLLIAIVVSVPTAVLAAVRKDRLSDHVIRIVSTATFTMPTFWLGLILVLVFSIRLHVFPVSGYGNGFVQHVYHLTLPSLAIGLALAPVILRVLRASLIEALDADYIEAARARGLGGATITFKHALKNSILAPLTVLAILVGVLLSGTVLAESVFALPGLGTLLISSVIARDYPTVQALVLIFGAAVICANLAADLLYPLIDHRVRL